MASYMSPEQITGSKIDQRSDLYCLSVVLYQAITGRVPFGASPEDTFFAIAFKQVQEPPPLPSQFVPGLPPQVDQVLMKALEKDPAKRYQSATEMIAALTTS
jgi:serine/threonine protein kinase